MNTKNKTPNASTIEAARLASIRHWIDSADLPAKKAKAAEAAENAEALRKTAEALTEDWRTLKRAQDDRDSMTDDLDLDDSESDRADVREAFKAAKQARARAASAEDKAEALAEEVNALTAYADRIPTGRDLAAVVRLLTEEDKAYHAAAHDLALLECDPNATREALKAARERRAAAKKAAEAAEETAPRFAFFFGAVVNDERPTAALALGHILAAATVDRLGLTADVARIAVTINALDRDLALAAARAAAKRSAANAVLRQGTPTQWGIYNAARAGRWTDYDLADMTAATIDPILTATAPADLAKAERRAAAVMHKAAERLTSLAEADTIARAAVMQAARRACDDPRLIDDPRKMTARANVIDLALAARAEAAKATDDLAEADAIHKATRAAFAAVNNHLGDCRAIRAAATVPTVNLDDLASTLADPRSIAADSVTEYEARKRETIRAAVPVAVAEMTPAQLQTFKALIRTGGNDSAAARKTRRSRATLLEHKAAAARKIAAAVAEVAPESIEAHALAAIVETTAAEAAAALASARAAKARAAQKAISAEKAAALAARADLAEAVAAAVAEAVEAMPPAMRETARLIAKGTGKREAARILGKNEKTVREAAKAAAARIRDAIKAAAPAADVPENADLGDLLRIAAAV